jgi:hypothetical protein
MNFKFPSMTYFFHFQNLKKRYVLLFLVMLVSMKGFAAVEPSNTRISGANVKGDPTITYSVMDNKFGIMQANPAWPSLFTNQKVTNTITFSVDQTSNKYQGADYTAVCSLEVKYYKWNVNKFDVVTLNPILTIDFKKSAPFKDKQSYQFTGGNKMEVRILNVTPDPTNGASPVMNLALDLNIEVERYYNFSASAQIAATDLSHTDLTATRGELQLNWNVIDGAEEYDVEWTYVNNYDGAGGALTAVQTLIPSDIFKFNSTRISTSQTFYKIPVIYDQGYILYRIRGVGRTGTNFSDKVFGLWSSFPDACTTVFCFPHKFPDALKSETFAGHQGNLNWQYNANYSENGKSKVGVGYFDGVLKTRQTVGKLKTEDKTVVGETIYDYQGRAAINVLPVPNTTPKIQYNDNFNRKLANDSAYNKYDFDIDASCVSATQGMGKDVSGASMYYSDKNPDKTLATTPPNIYNPKKEDYIPNANNFPFTQTVFTPDNTGRIKSQSGVGINHKIGSGHETKYFYGKPLPGELERLFGSEVGEANRYNKKVTQDANGQLTVEYLDPQGKVIATALAGNKPDSLLKLDSYDGASTVWI